MRELSTEGLKELFKSASQHALIPLATLAHPAMETQRFAANTRAIEHNGHRFAPFPFKLTLPEQVDGKMPMVELVAYDVGYQLVAHLRRIHDPIDVTLEAVRVAPDGAVTPEWGPMTLKLMEASPKADQIKLKLGVEVDVLNAPATQHKLTPQIAPGLFR